APERIEEGMDLLAGQPCARAGAIERSTACDHDVPALAQLDLVGAKPGAVHPDLLQMPGNGIAREEMACRGKAQPRGIAGLQPRPPGVGVAHDVVLEATPGLVDRVPEIRWRARSLRHAPQRIRVGFSPRELGLLPALNQ